MKVDELQIKLLNYRQDLVENLVVNDSIKISSCFEEISKFCTDGYVSSHGLIASRASEKSL